MSPAERDQTSSCARDLRIICSPCQAVAAIWSNLRIATALKPEKDCIAKASWGESTKFIQRFSGFKTILQ
jgi:hypothetical protein